MDLRRETDVALLRRIALTQQTQIEQLVRVLTLKCRELEKLKGHDKELQQTLALVEALTKKATAAAPGGEESPPSGRSPRSRERNGARRRSRVSRSSPNATSSTTPTSRVRAAAASSSRWRDSRRLSEMVDFVEVRYRLVKVEQQKPRPDGLEAAREGGPPEGAVADLVRNRARRRGPSHPEGQGS